MTFMDSLKTNPSGSSGVYGAISPSNDNDTLSIVDRLKDREMQDFKDKAHFMSNLSLQQDRLRRLYDPSVGPKGAQTPEVQQNLDRGQGQEQNPTQGMNVSQVRDPNQMTGYEKGELSIRQQGLGQEQQKINQAGKLGEERLGIQTAQEKLNQQKSDQANAAKQADLERKINEANQKIELAQQALQQKGDNAAATLEAHKTLAAAVEERHKLEMENMQHRFDVTSDQHQQTIDALNERIKQSKNMKQVKRDSAGNEITTETTKGDEADTVQAIGKDGKTYTIPRSKLDDKDADGTPHWKPGGEQ